MMQTFYDSDIPHKTLKIMSYIMQRGRTLCIGVMCMRDPTMSENFAHAKREIALLPGIKVWGDLQQHEAGQVSFREPT